MIKCSKCDSDMPNRYKYCIYCSNELEKTEANSYKLTDRCEFTAGQIGILVGSVLMAAAAVIGLFMI